MEGNTDENRVRIHPFRGIPYTIICFFVLSIAAIFGSVINEIVQENCEICSATRLICLVTSVAYLCRIIYESPTMKAVSFGCLAIGFTFSVYSFSEIIWYQFEAIHLILRFAATVVFFGIVLVELHNSKRLSYVFSCLVFATIVSALMSPQEKDRMNKDIPAVHGRIQVFLSFDNESRSLFKKIEKYLEKSSGIEAWLYDEEERYDVLCLLSRYDHLRAIEVCMTERYSGHQSEKIVDLKIGLDREEKALSAARKAKVFFAPAMVIVTVNEPYKLLPTDETEEYYAKVIAAINKGTSLPASQRPIPNSCCGKKQ